MGSAHCNHTFNARFFQPWVIQELQKILLITHFSWTSANVKMKTLRFDIPSVHY